MTALALVVLVSGVVALVFYVLAFMLMDASDVAILWLYVSRVAMAVFVVSNVWLVLGALGFRASLTLP